jgi:hypothetical protein
LDRADRRSNTIQEDETGERSSLIMLFIATQPILAKAGDVASKAFAPAAPAPELDGVMLFGFLAAIFAILCWMHRHQGRGARLGLAAGLAGLCVYAFLAGTWPLGMLLGIWSIDGARRSYFGSGRKGRSSRMLSINRPARARRVNPEWSEASRITRMFGPTP